jgi:hypothetical protein
MIVEYAGIADRWAGPGEVHNVRAWWNAVSDSQADVKRAAVRLVKAEVTSPHVTFEAWGMDTSTHPTINAFIRVRVISPERHAEIQQLKTVRVHTCTECDDPHPSSYLLLTDGRYIGACFVCVRKLSERGEISRNLASVGRGGKLTV